MHVRARSTIYLLETLETLETLLIAQGLRVACKLEGLEALETVWGCRCESVPIVRFACGLAGKVVFERVPAEGSGLGSG